MQPKPNSIKAETPAVEIGGHILIVEDEYVVANDLQFILENAGYSVTGIAASVSEALELIEARKPDVVLLDIFLQGKRTGIDLAGQLTLAGIPFIYLSANSNQSVLEQVKATQPYGFIVKPFREKDLLITLQMILYRHAHRLELRLRQEQTLQIAITDTLSGAGGWEERLLEVTRLLQPHIPSDFLVMGLENDKDLTKKAPLPAPPSGAPVSSSWPTGARSSWMKSGKCPWNSRPSCCGCCRNGKLNGWAAKAPSKPTCALWRPPTGTWKRK